MKKRWFTWIWKGIVSILLLISLSVMVIWFTPTLKLQAFKWVFESSERQTLVELEQNKIDFSHVNVERDIPYRQTGNQGHLLDIYRPKKEVTTKPLIINIHGGGLFASYKETNLKFNLEFVKRGHTVVNVSYRLIPETTFWHQIDDIMTAYRYLVTHQDSLNLNLDQVYVVGDSAGALLSLMSTAINSSPELQETFNMPQTRLTIKGLGLISIMLDNQRQDIMSLINDYIVTDEDKKRPSLAYLLNPSSIIEKTELPPVYLITSEEDLIQSDTLKLEKRLKENHVPYQLKNYEKDQHNKLVHVFATLHPEWSESQEVIDHLSVFTNQ
ncbi:alpha/beta hydrolase [Streptococcus sp. S784/96/1]|uniref:alpha/beta hydrolase n=1 Tax=Streptococcus sp. S784/96/1 TaxID=2653499 RepID=UPI00138A3AB2|nr:alpha/beta hydrolase [Streptococcus sp. S784/96/1]